MTTVEIAGKPAQEPARKSEKGNLAQRLNWLRAGVLGANDGIVSVAAIVVGVAGATTAQSTSTAQAAALAAGAAGLIGGAISMALGEYVSVSSQSDSQRALVAQERKRLADDPGREFERLKTAYLEQGISPETAQAVAEELTRKNALSAQLRTHYNIDEEEIVSPWHAALASALAFTVGAILPLLSILLFPAPVRLPLTFAVVLVALAVTGAVGAWIGGAKASRAATRVVLGGALALGATFLIGSLLGHSGIV
ncbi:VIT family protein [Arthrobacter sp. NPDC090010]|uniref:VIT1/CCC1 transporter family protein n=1 Tax=Arthrobacter sp. NPDC090010 TaxID=3363942 RepID=UPI0037FBF884